MTNDECQVSFTWPYFRVARNFVTLFSEYKAQDGMAAYRFRRLAAETISGANSY